MSYEMLLSPMNIGKMTVKNRLVMPTAETSMGDMTGKATERMISYYAERARKRTESGAHVAGRAR